VTLPYAEGMFSGVRSRTSALLVTGVTEPPAPRPAWQRRGRFDLVVAADVFVALISFLVANDHFRYPAADHAAGLPSEGVATLVALALCAPLVLRTYLPLTAWSACTLASLWASRALPASSVSGGYIPAVLVYALCLYAVAIRCKAWVVSGAAVATVLVATVVEGHDAVTVILFTAVPVFAGIIIRSRRAGREQLEVAERRHEGERALLEERQRIARELHDVVAHHMSVIAIQAEAAPYKTAHPQPELVESFGQIRASALSGLGELRRVLGVLRSESPDVAPQPGLDDLPGLIESARSGGVTVAAAVTGTPRPLPAGVDLSAYRIVQEALSNAMRHAPGSAVQVRLSYREDAVVIEVRSSGGGPAPRGAGDQPARPALGAGGGHGIIGMRERATMLGGCLEAGPSAKDGFLVTASLPLAPGGPEDTP
jgi:signal transduction histidine kinase